MADVNDQQLSDLINSLNKQTGSLTKLTSKLDDKDSKFKSRSEALSELEDDLTKSGQKRQTLDRKMYDSAKKFNVSLDGMASGLIKAGGIGFVLGEIINWGKSATNTFRELSNVGMNFNGSMVAMQAAAMDAGLPLEKFGKALIGSSAVIGKIGTKNFMDIQKQFRGLAESSGLYGMSLDQLIEFQGDYLETQRLSGALTRSNSAKQAKAINDFAITVGSISEVTKKSKKDIMDQTNAALRDSVVTAAMAGNVSKGMDAYNEQVSKAVASLAGQNGAAGQMLSKGLADTFSHFGQAQLTSIGQTLIKAGAPAALNVLNEANRRLAAGEDGAKVGMEVANQLKDLLSDPAMLKSLQLQAAVGNESAAAVIDMTQNLQKYSQAEIDAGKKAVKSADFVTTFFTSFESVTQNLLGSFTKGILAPFITADDPTGGKKLVETISNLGPPLEKFGQAIGAFMSSTFADPEKVKYYADGFFMFIDGAIKIGGALTTAFGWILGAVTKFNNFMGGLLGNKGLGGFMNSLLPVIELLGAFAAFKGIKSILDKLFGSSKVITVKGNAYISARNAFGGGGGGDLLGDVEDMIGDKDGSSKGRRAKRRRTGALTRSRRRGGGKVGKIMNLLGDGEEIIGDVGKGAKPMGKIMGGIAKAGKGVMGIAGKAGEFLEKSHVKSFGKALGWVGTAVGAVGGAYELYNGVMSGKLDPKSAGKGLAKLTGSLGGGFLGADLGAAGGAAIGATIGGIIGSVIPVAGTAAGIAAGAWIGGALGGAGGAYVGSKIGEGGAGMAYDGATNLYDASQKGKKGGSGAGAMAAGAVAGGVAATMADGTEVKDAKPAASPTKPNSGSGDPNIEKEMLIALRKNNELIEQLIATTMTIGRDQVNQLRKVGGAAVTGPSSN